MRLMPINRGNKTKREDMIIFTFLSHSLFNIKYINIPHNETDARVWLLGNEYELSLINLNISGLGL